LTYEFRLKLATVPDLVPRRHIRLGDA